MNLVGACYWQVAEGGRSIDLNGDSFDPGGMSQTIVTSPGKTYVITFSMAGNPDREPIVKHLRLTAASQSADFEFDMTGRTRAAMGWATRSWTFEAVASTTTIEFRSLDVTQSGPVIDNVQVIQFGVRGTVTGTIWRKPEQGAPVSTPIPGVLVEAIRDGQALQPSAYADVSGDYELALWLQPSDVIRVTAKNEWLEVGVAGQPNPAVEQVVGADPVVDINWAPTGGYSGDELNAYLVAEDFGRRFWRDHMNRSPNRYFLRTSAPNTCCSGASTGRLASGEPTTSFAPGKVQLTDAVCHEFVHGIVIQQLGHLFCAENTSDKVDSGRPAASLDEGLADYFTYAFTSRADFGEGIAGAERPLDQPTPVKLPWCTGYADHNKGYTAGSAIAGALFDLRADLGVPDFGISVPTGIQSRDFDQWVFAAAMTVGQLPILQRTPQSFRMMLEATPLGGELRANAIAAAFDRHNIKQQPDVSLWCGIATNIISSVRTVTGTAQTVEFQWTPVERAVCYRVYLEPGVGAPGGLGPGVLIADALLETSFAYNDPDTAARFTLVVVPVDADGVEGDPSGAVPAGLLDVREAPGLSGTTRIVARPNPARSDLTLTVDAVSEVAPKFEIYDVHGRRRGALRPFLNSRHEWEARWNRLDDGGQPVEPGSYFLLLHGSGRSSCSRIVLLDR